LTGVKEHIKWHALPKNWISATPPVHYTEVIIFTFKVRRFVVKEQKICRINAVLRQGMPLQYY
jgi:hypothetical protein